MLRIETGMHNAMISRIAVDAAGRYLVTGSEDKTVRVWELSTGRLLRTLRPPIGYYSEGMIKAVAISPDGQYVAAAGEIGARQYKDSHWAYIFNRESGQMLDQERLPGAPGTVPAMTFSPDGTKLVIIIVEEDGFSKIVNEGSGKIVKEGFGRIHVVHQQDKGLELWSSTRGYGNDEEKYHGLEINGIDFDRAGRMVTTCTDGYLRLHDQNVKLLRQVRAPAEGRLHAVRFSPDGSKLAVGYADRARVDVLDGKSLDGIYQPDTSGVGNGDLRAVEWSADGSALYAAGGWHNGTGAYLIRRWAEAGRGRYQDLTAAGDTIMDLAPLADGGVVFGTQEPSWGVFSANGERLRFVARETADYRDNQKGFLTNETGSVVAFAYESSGKSPAVFSVVDRQLKPGAGFSDSLRPARIDGLTIKDSEEPMRSFAIAPDAKSFLLAGDHSMFLLGRNSEFVWGGPILSPARSVNISGNGKLAIVAFADGAIRWFRMTDGEELLTFFPHKSGKHWALWTPSGYYDYSPGAENLIGWHVNEPNYLDRSANFFPIERFRSNYYRPDVVSRILETGDEEEALRLADEKLASEKSERPTQKGDVKGQLSPVINIISPTDNSEIKSTTVVVRYSLRSPSSSPVTGVKAFIDGQPASAERGVGARLQDGQTGELTVTVPRRDCELALVAENQYASSAASVVKLHWRGASEPELVKPKLYILAVGVAQYRNPSWNLTYPAKDARDFVEVMRSQEGGLYRQVEFKLLTDKEATKDNILDGLEWIQRQTTSRDVAMVFFAGHGVNDNLNRYFFCSYNFEDQSLMRTGVAYTDIRSVVEAIAGKALFFVDTCHAGNAVGSGSRGGVADIDSLVNELSSVENGVIVFTAATGRQSSLEDAKWGNGAFTKALVEGLKGEADYTKRGKITVSLLDFYVTERVKELTDGKQTPATVKPDTVPDFPIAIKK